ncbi:MAG: hypothetical protein IJ946_00445 [Clostridia bacterium]|nr:hypothetical protein [Clostridia bacterium]
MFNFSIMPLDLEHIDEICQDIKYQYENGTASMALFIMQLVPEGDPVIPKAERQCEIYAKFKERLDAMGLKSGILAQCTIGHGYPLAKPSSFTKVVNLTDGEEAHVVCPYDEGFREYIRHAFSVLASYNPDHIMLDDDFRLIIREGKGCACGMHLDAFERKTGVRKTREEIAAHVFGKTKEDEKYRDAFVETQLESLRECVKYMREGIDSVNPQIPGSFSCVGPCCEAATEIATTMAGKGNPVILRINNGNYHPVGTKRFSNIFMRAAVQMAVLKGQGKVDSFLAETDTCPQNRYSTGAMSLHSHFVGTILEGVSGAKHWITRLTTFEPQSGKKYREVLGKHNKWYETLSALVPTLKWRGAGIPISSKPDYCFEESNSVSGWGTCVLERLGIPMYFSSDDCAVTFLDGSMTDLFDDEKIKAMLKGTLVLDGGAAVKLCERGFAKELGVEVFETPKYFVSREFFADNEKRFVNRQTNSREIKPISDGVRVLTRCFVVSNGQDRDDMPPASTTYKNSLGGTAIVFAGDAKTEFHYTTAFGFLNATRKDQFISLLKEYGDLPVYTPDDDEIYLKAADMEDGSLFCALFNVSMDPVDNIRLCLQKTPSNILELDLNGEFTPVEYKAENGEYVLNKPAHIITPVILKIEY